MKPFGWPTTDVGRKRDFNEDSYLCNDRLGLYAVADGMGGHRGGERASRMAVDILEREVQAAAATQTDVAAMMKSAAQAAAGSIYAAAQADPEYAGMGTTLSSILLHGDRATVCHVGDSRVYLYRDGKARQITQDHSWIAEQIRAGLLAPDDAIATRFRNVITRSVGFEQFVDPDVMGLPIETGDCFVLCSDGLSNHLSVEDIGEILTLRFYQDASRGMVDLANQRGGEDNITALVVYVANEA